MLLLRDIDARFLTKSSGSRWLLLALAALCALPPSTRAYDLHFDYTSFETGFQQPQFNVLNYPSINGNYMMTSTDNHRPEMVANGNALAEFYNFLQDRYSAHAVKDGNLSADEIDAYVVSNSTNNGAKPNWLVLNEISSSLWQVNPGAPSDSVYRSWLIDCVTRLHEHYGYDVVTLAPFQNPGQSNASWQALAEVSYIGIECYLSGTEVMNSGATNAQRQVWAEGQYQASKNSYLNRGVPEDKLFVIEHFANNDTTFTDGQGNVMQTGWGRAGLASAADWDTVIQIRQDAILNVGFDGFLAYNWGGNAMGVSLNEQLQHEYYYRSRRVLASQKPQWLSDAAISVSGTTVPLSWSQPLNWIGGVPNASGAEANFWRTLSANRIVTLDGSKTVGKLTFDSSFSYTISAGSSGNLVFNNASAAATLTSDQGSHAISANVQLTSNLIASINTSTFTISGIVSGAGGLIKKGAGTLSLTNANTYSGDTTVEGGTLRINGRYLSDTAAVLISSGAALQLNFAGSPDVIDALFINGIAQPRGIWGPLGSVSQFTTTLLTGTGRLQVTNGPLPGDFNVDGVIDAADYVLWRKQFGTPYLPNDYNTWRTNFSESETGVGAGRFEILPGGPRAIVPEPASGIAFSVGIFAILLYWPHGFSSHSASLHAASRSGCA